MGTRWQKEEDERWSCWDSGRDGLWTKSMCGYLRLSRAKRHEEEGKERAILGQSSQQQEKHQFLGLFLGNRSYPLPPHPTPHTGISTVNPTFITRQLVEWTQQKWLEWSDRTSSHALVASGSCSEIFTYRLHRLYQGTKPGKSQLLTSLGGLGGSKQYF